MKRRAFITLLGGSAAGWPLAARTQQPAMPVIGFVRDGSAGANARYVAAFHKGLNEIGIVEGQNVMVEYHWLEGKYDRLQTLMADLAPRPAAGQGFGLGFAVRTAAGRNPLPGSIGTYYWTGAYGTTFWIDPSEKLIGILMIQAPLPETPPYRRAMRYLTYQALLNARE